MSRSFSLNDLLDSNEAVGPPQATANQVTTSTTPTPSSLGAQVYQSPTTNGNGVNSSSNCIYQNSLITNLIKAKTVNKSSPILNDSPAANENNLTELSNFMLMASQTTCKKQQQQQQQQHQLLQFIQAKVMNTGKQRSILYY